MKSDRFGPQLVASYWTIAGHFPGIGANYSPFDFADRVAAASKAGFCGMGLLDTDLAHVLETYSLSECKRILDDHGITHIELEFLVDWFTEGELRRKADQQKKFLFDAAEILRPRLFKVGDFSRSDCPMPRLIDSFAQLCCEARSLGANVAFEPMGAALIRSLPEALELVRGAAAPNGGLAIDIWHMENLGIPLEEVAKIPQEFLLCVELNDARIDPSADTNPSVDRGFCGEGDLDVKAFVAAIKKTGFEGPWGIEIFSDALVKLSLEDAAGRAVRTTEAQFE